MRVCELFTSVQGEGIDAGRLCTFVRFSGCNLRCSYCDTSYAWHEPGEDLTVEAIVERVTAAGCELVCLTGGEPMMQAEAITLMAALLATDHEVLLETNGAVPLTGVPAAVTKIVDVKTPGALRRPGDSQADFEGRPFFYPNLETLTRRDQVKLVLCDRADYEWALGFVAQHGLSDRVSAVLLSACHPALSPAELVGWMLEDRPPVRLNVQIHKMIWDPDKRGV